VQFLPAILCNLKSAMTLGRAYSGLGRRETSYDNPMREQTRRPHRSRRGALYALTATICAIIWPRTGPRSARSSWGRSTSTWATWTTSISTWRLRSPGVSGHRLNPRREGRDPFRTAGEGAWVAACHPGGADAGDGGGDYEERAQGGANEGVEVLVLPTRIGRGFYSRCHR
jgi:hypothetical protein